MDIFFSFISEAFIYKFIFTLKFEKINHNNRIAFLMISFGTMVYQRVFFHVEVSEVSLKVNICWTFTLKLQHRM